MTSSKLKGFWKNLVLFSFEKLTIVTRRADGSLKKRRFLSHYDMISFYENATGMRFGLNRVDDSERLLRWRST